MRLAEEEKGIAGAGTEREEVSQARRRDEIESGVMATARIAPSSMLDPAPSEVSQVARRIEKLIPRMLVRMNEISKFPIDPRSAFLLGYVDGSLSVEEILDLCALPASEALEVVDRLQRLGVIALG